MDSLVIGLHIIALYSNNAEATKPINEELIMDTGVEGTHLLHCTETCKLRMFRRFDEIQYVSLHHSCSNYRIFQIWNILIIESKINTAAIYRLISHP